MHFKNPPIVEAVIAFDVSPLPLTALVDFQVGALVMEAAGYLPPEPVTKHEVQIRLEGGTSSFDAKGPSSHGLKFRSSDGMYAVQFNRDGFIFSRMEQYQTWELFRTECKKIWDIYFHLSGITEIITYTVRYINKLYIPLGEDSEDYVRIFPRLPPEIPNLLSESFMRLNMPIEKPRGRLIHQQMTLPSDKTGFSPLLLDNTFQFGAIGMSPEAVWQELETVRYVKDQYFEYFTTEKMRDTFNA